MKLTVHTEKTKVMIFSNGRISKKVISILTIKNYKLLASLNISYIGIYLS